MKRYVLCMFSVAGRKFKGHCGTIDFLYKRGRMSLVTGSQNMTGVEPILYHIPKFIIIDCHLFFSRKLKEVGGSL